MSGRSGTTGDRLAQVNDLRALFLATSLDGLTGYQQMLVQECYEFFTTTGPALVEVAKAAREREYREHGRGCGCSLGKAVARLDSGAAED